MIAPDSSIAVARLQRIFFFLLLCFPSFCDGQQAQFPIEKWMTRLSVKSDPGLVNLMAVAHEICALDTNSLCQALIELESRCQTANTRCRIRFSLIKNDASKGHSACRDITCSSITWSLEETKEMLRWAYEIEDPYLIAFGNKILAHDYEVLGEHGMSVVHKRIAIEDLAHLYPDQPTENMVDYFRLGESLYHTREYRAAIQSFQIALASTENPSIIPWPIYENQDLHMFLYNTMGLAYQKLHEYDSAFIAFDRALTYAQADSTWTSLIQGNRGDLFFIKEQFDSAKVLLAIDVKGSLTGGPEWADNAANSMQWLARIKTIEGDPQGAVSQLRAADLQLKKLPNPKYQANIFYAFIQAFEKLGKADSVYAYMQKYHVVHDSLEQQAANANAEIVEMRLENQASIHKITSLNKEKRRIALIRNFVIALTLLASGFGFLLINRDRLRLKLRQQEAMREKAIAEKETADAQSQLSVFTQHLIEKNSLVEKLQEQLLRKEVTDQQVHDISALSQHVILTDQDWARFKLLFEKVYPGFFQNLKTTSSDITVAEQRIAALAKLQITSKEASALLGISPASVNKTRQRLRSRLGLDPEADLEAYFG